MNFRFRPQPELLDQIDALLAKGEPTPHQFMAYDLMALGEYVTEHWDELPFAVAGRDDYRRCVRPGVTVAAIGLLAQQVGDEIVGIDISVDRHGLPDPDADPPT